MKIGNWGGPKIGTAFSPTTQGQREGSNVCSSDARTPPLLSRWDEANTPAGERRRPGADCTAERDASFRAKRFELAKCEHVFRLVECQHRNVGLSSC